MILVIQFKADRRFKVTSQIVEMSLEASVGDSGLFACAGSFHGDAQPYLIISLIQTLGRKEGELHSVYPDKAL